MEQLSNLPGSNVETVRGLIEPVYRYHLARSENYLEAQNLTAHTLQSALKGLDTHFSKTHSELMTWVMGIARYQQAYGRRHNSLSRSLSEKADTGHIPGMLEYLESPHASVYQNEEQEDQHEVLLRDQMAHLSSSWKHLPRNQADALALHFFGGLSLSETGKIIRRKEADVQRLLSSQLPFQKELADLAENIHPNRDFVAALVSSFNNKLHNEHSSFWKRLPPLLLPEHGPWRNVLNTGARVGLIAGLLVVGLFVILHQAAANNPAATAQTPTPQATPAVSNAPLDNRGMLVPPSTDFCQNWKYVLAGSTGADLTLTTSPYKDPTQTSPDANGTGCQLSATVSSASQQSAWRTMEKVSSLLLADKFSQSTASNLVGAVDDSYFGSGCSGLYRTFASSSNVAILSISWCKNTSSSQSLTMTTPTSPTPNAYFGQRTSYWDRPYTLKLTLATSIIKPMLKDLFIQWGDATNLVYNYLSPQALKHYPTLAALDQLAGINRNSGQQLAFSWQVIDNSGTKVRLEVTVTNLAADGTPQGKSDPFQIVWVQSDGVWFVQDLGAVVPFS